MPSGTPRPLRAGERRGCALWRVVARGRRQLRMGAAADAGRAKAARSILLLAMLVCARAVGPVRLPRRGGRYLCTVAVAFVDYRWIKIKLIGTGSVGSLVVMSWFPVRGTMVKENTRAILSRCGKELPIYLPRAPVLCIIRPQVWRWAAGRRGPHPPPSHMDLAVSSTSYTIGRGRPPNDHSYVNTICFHWLALVDHYIYSYAEEVAPFNS